MRGAPLLAADVSAAAALTAPAPEPAAPKAGAPATPIVFVGDAVGAIGEAERDQIIALVTPYKNAVLQVDL